MIETIQSTQKAQIGEVAELTVVSTQEIGTFLDWGMPKDLFLPFGEQIRPLREGDKVIVYLYVDNNQRSCASMKVEKFLEKNPGDLKEKQPVDLLILAETDLGFKAVIDGKYLGMVYRNEIFKAVREGQRMSGFIKKIRGDGKIDLALQRTGYRAVPDIEKNIVQLLESRGGFLPVGDKTSAEVIYDLFGVSKKKFKMSIGGLFKRKVITIENDGIYLYRTKNFTAYRNF